MSNRTSGTDMFSQTNSEYQNNVNFQPHNSILSNTPDDDEQDSDSPEVPRVRRGGRRKIDIEYIKDKSRRHITFSKRKAGIMKKAYELSTLTGTQVLLLVVSETGLVYTFTTPKLQPMVTNTDGKNLIQSCLNSPDDDTKQDSSDELNNDSISEPKNDNFSSAPKKQNPKKKRDAKSITEPSNNNPSNNNRNIPGSEFGNFSKPSYAPPPPGAPPTVSSNPPSNAAMNHHNSYQNQPPPPGSELASMDCNYPSSVANTTYMNGPPSNNYGSHNNNSYNNPGSNPGHSYQPPPHQYSHQPNYNNYPASSSYAGSVSGHNPSFSNQQQQPPSSFHPPPSSNYQSSGYPTTNNHYSHPPPPSNMNPSTHNPNPSPYNYSNPSQP